MRFLKTKNQYKANNFMLDLNTLDATSYEWYHMLKKIKGKVVFNTYNYSQSTVRHLGKLRRLINEHNIKVDLEIIAPKGLGNLQASLE